MSFAALFWAITAMMQCCMLSQFGQKQLQYGWLTQHVKKLLYIVTIVFLMLSLLLNCRYEGSSVGILSWFFVILTAAFFLQTFAFYWFRKHFALIWQGCMMLALIFSVLEWMN